MVFNILKTGIYIEGKKDKGLMRHFINFTGELKNDFFLVFLKLDSERFKLKLFMIIIFNIRLKNV